MLVTVSNAGEFPRVRGTEFRVGCVGMGMDGGQQSDRLVKFNNEVVIVLEEWQERKEKRIKRLF